MRHPHSVWASRCCVAWDSLAGNRRDNKATPRGVEKRWIHPGVKRSSDTWCLSSEEYSHSLKRQCIQHHPSLFSPPAVLQRLNNLFASASYLRLRIISGLNWTFLWVKSVNISTRELFGRQKMPFKTYVFHRTFTWSWTSPLCFSMGVTTSSGLCVAATCRATSGLAGCKKKNANANANMDFRSQQPLFLWVCCCFRWYPSIDECSYVDAGSKHVWFFFLHNMGILCVTATKSHILVRCCTFIIGRIPSLPLEKVRNVIEADHGSGNDEKFSQITPPPFLVTPCCKVTNHGVAPLRKCHPLQTTRWNPNPIFAWNLSGAAEAWGAVQVFDTGSSRAEAVRHVVVEFLKGAGGQVVVSCVTTICAKWGAATASGLFIWVAAKLLRLVFTWGTLY